MMMIYNDIYIYTVYTVGKELYRYHLHISCMFSIIMSLLLLENLEKTDYVDVEPWLFNPGFLDNKAVP